MEIYKVLLNFIERFVRCYEKCKAIGLIDPTSPDKLSFGGILFLVL